MSAQPDSSRPEITQRDLRHRSREIMDAVERGQGFTVTRDGHRIGELLPHQVGPDRGYDQAAERARRDDFLGLDELLSVVAVTRPA